MKRGSIHDSDNPALWLLSVTTARAVENRTRESTNHIISTPLKHA